MTAARTRLDAAAALRRLQDAVVSCDEAIGRKPDDANTFKRRCTALAARKRHSQAHDSQGRALALQPDGARRHRPPPDADADRLKEITMLHPLPTAPRAAPTPATR